MRDITSAKYRKLTSDEKKYFPGALRVRINDNGSVEPIGVHQDHYLDANNVCVICGQREVKIK